MAQTLAEIATQLRAEFPEIREDRNGAPYVLPQMEYDACIDEWAQVELDRQLKDEAKAAARTDESDAQSQIAQFLAQMQTDHANLVDPTIPNSALTVGIMRTYLTRLYAFDLQLVRLMRRRGMLPDGS